MTKRITQELTRSLASWLLNRPRSRRELLSRRNGTVPTAAVRAKAEPDLLRRLGYAVFESTPFGPRHFRRATRHASMARGLFGSGTLGYGIVRHYSEWTFPEPRKPGFSPAARPGLCAERRRSLAAESETAGWRNFFHGVRSR